MSYNNTNAVAVVGLDSACFIQHVKSLTIELICPNSRIQSCEIDFEKGYAKSSHFGLVLPYPNNKTYNKIQGKTHMGEY